MCTTKEIADDYYLNGLNNAAIFEKYKLERKKANITKERVFHHLPVYKHKNLRCMYCDSAMISTYVSKSAKFASDNLSDEEGGKVPKTEALIRVEPKQKMISLWYREGTAYSVDGGHRISAPICEACSHELTDNCKCSHCLNIKELKASEAADVLMEEFRLKLVGIEELSPSRLLGALESLSTLMDKPTRQASSINGLNLEQKESLITLGVTSPIPESILSAVKMVSKNEYYVKWSLIKFKFKSFDILIETITKLKFAALSQIRNDLGVMEILELWENLAHQEAVGVLEYYCDVHDIYYQHEDKIHSAIRRSLKRYGLAQTARYIYNAVWNARKYSSEQSYNKYRAFTFIYGNLNFWVEDERAQAYNAQPFVRTDKLLSEPASASVFSRFFLEPHGINYFSDTVSIDSLSNKDA